MSDAAARATVTGDTRQETELDKMYGAARAMERIEAAGDREAASWTFGLAGYYMTMGFGHKSRSAFVSRTSLRNDEQDPLLAAEQAAMEELKGDQ